MRHVLAGLLFGAAISPIRAQDASREIPFEFLHNQIVIQGMLDGRGPFSFILDTGTRGSSLDLRVAKELRLPLGRPVSIDGVGQGRRTPRSTTSVELSIAGISNRIEVALFDLSGISRSLGWKLHGVLGFGFLDSQVVQIDYFHRRIRFYGVGEPLHGGSDSDQKSITFAMQFHANSVLPVLQECYVNGVRLPVTIDTGSSLGLVLFPRTIEQLGLTALAESGLPMEAAGYLGAARLTKGWVRSLMLKDVDLGAVELAYVRKGYADDEDPRKRGGSIGNAILQDFVLILDYPGRRGTLRSAGE